MSAPPAIPRVVHTPRGFTLVELLVVMAILGVLASAAVPLAQIALQRDRERELKYALWQIRDAIDQYRRAVDAGTIPRVPGTSGYPPDLPTLTRGVPDATAMGRTQYFLRRIPRDPFADAMLAPEATWALRCYESPPDRPRPGSDVYDVASRSALTGLNGVPLRDW
jgi:general secretion pathway protein G